MTTDETVIDGYWTAPCRDGCDGTGRYVTVGLPDFGGECVACKGTGRTLLTLAQPRCRCAEAPEAWRWCPLPQGGHHEG